MEAVLSWPTNVAGGWGAEQQGDKRRLFCVFAPLLEGARTLSVVTAFIKVTS